MMIKEPTIFFANDLSGTFKVGIPELSSDAIRIPAFDFRVFEAGTDFGKWHESALLVFEGVVSSTRQVKLFANKSDANGTGNYKIVDGPFNYPNADPQLYHFNFSVYANSAKAWVEWDITAQSVHVAPIDRKTLIQFAQLREVRLADAKSALENANRRAIELLLYRMKFAEDYQLILPLYCKELIQVAKEKGKLLEIADMLIQEPNRALLNLADELSVYHTEGVAALIRDIIAAGLDASTFVIKTLYNDENGLTQALLDPCEAVRIFAAKTLETHNDISGLILCLNNDSARVREIAGWYLGRKKVLESADALVKQITTEKFTLATLTHAQVEALRAAIWALGILSISSVRPYLQSLTNHDHQLIRDTAIRILSQLE